MSRKGKCKVNKSEFIRQIIMAYCRGELQWVPKQEGPFGFSQIRYRVMTDENGQKWDVPVTEDLRKHDPARWKHTFVRIKVDPETVVADD
jgi:hypothetical protein